MKRFICLLALFLTGCESGISVYNGCPDSKLAISRNGDVLYAWLYHGERVWVSVPGLAGEYVFTADVYSVHDDTPLGTASKKIRVRERRGGTTQSTADDWVIDKGELKGEPSWACKQ